LRASEKRIRRVFEEGPLGLAGEFRQHYPRLGRKPAVWFFPGGTHHTADTPISERVVWHACRRAAQRCGVNKPLTLRHC
jgi:integrase/recombinase XerD